MTKSLLNFHCEVAKSDEGMSLRKYLQQRFGLSSTRLKSLRRRGISRINGLHKPLITILHSGDIIDVTCPEISAPELDLDALERASCPVVYQDEHYLLVNKPPGLLVHPSYQETLAITTLLSSEPLHPVRRLDLDTSGLVLIALNPYAHERLIFSELEKRYRVLVYGRLPERALSLSLPQSRNPKLTLQRIVSRTGQVSIGPSTRSLSSMSRPKQGAPTRSAASSSISASPCSGTGSTASRPWRHTWIRAPFTLLRRAYVPKISCEDISSRRSRATASRARPSMPTSCVLET